MSFRTLITASALMAGLVMGGTASAATVTVSTNTILGTPPGSVLSPTSADGTFRDNITENDVGGNSGSIEPGNSRSVWDGTAYEGEAVYSSVQGGGFAEYVFESAQTEFNFTWGSPDDYNTLSFFDDDALIYSITGDSSDIVPPGTSGLGFVNVFFNFAGGTFDTVLFESTTDAFEYARVNTSPVPLPAAAWFLLSALGALGGLRVMRKRTAV